jgi:hypothetical protein
LVKIALPTAGKKGIEAMWSSIFHNLGATAMKKLANIPNKRLEATLVAHAIERDDWHECKQLVIYGARISSDLKRRLNHVSNYKAWMNGILKELSKSCPHKFPPPDYRPSGTYQSLCGKAN